MLFGRKTSSVPRPLVLDAIGAPVATPEPVELAQDAAPVAEALHPAPAAPEINVLDAPLIEGSFGRIAPPVQAGWLERLSSGLQRSSRHLSSHLVSALTKKRLDQEALDELEEMLIEADLGVEAAGRITEAFARERFGKEATEAEVRESLAAAIAAELKPHEAKFEAFSGARPHVVLMVGVNGSGKTTTLGKIAASLKAEGLSVLVAAGDTFRAAAIEQLQVWAERAGAPIVTRPPGSDAASLAFEAVERARAEGIDVVLIDTAGRLQNKAGLMDELAKIVRVLKKLDPAYPQETLLVLDATVGRNALSQVEIFGKVAGVTGIVMTKLDGTARGGVLVPVAAASPAPIKLIGVGESIEDLQPFDALAFARSLVGVEAAAEPVA